VKLHGLERNLLPWTTPRHSPDVEGLKRAFEASVTTVSVPSKIQTSDHEHYQLSQISRPVISYSWNNFPLHTEPSLNLCFCWRASILGPVMLLSCGTTSVYSSLTVQLWARHRASSLMAYDGIKYKMVALWLRREYRRYFGETCPSASPSVTKCQGHGPSQWDVII
jgi:hypothetical protein